MELGLKRIFVAFVLAALKHLLVTDNFVTNVAWYSLCIEDDADLQAIREAKNESVYDQKEAEDYIFMNPVKRERIDRGWTQEDLAERLGVKQSTIAKWERKGAVYRKDTRYKLAKVFGMKEDVFR